MAQATYKTKQKNETKQKNKTKQKTKQHVKACIGVSKSKTTITTNSNTSFEDNNHNTTNISISKKTKIIVPIVLNTTQQVTHVVSVQVLTRVVMKIKLTN